MTCSSTMESVRKRSTVPGAMRCRKEASERVTAPSFKQLMWRPLRSRPWNPRAFMVWSSTAPQPRPLASVSSSMDAAPGQIGRPVAAWYRRAVYHLRSVRAWRPRRTSPEAPWRHCIAVKRNRR